MSVRRLSVWLTLPDGERIHAGEMAFTEAASNGFYRSAFRYTRGYLAHPRRFALDPANLPLREGDAQSDLLEAPLGVIHDALPDAWGRRLIGLQGQCDGRQYREPDMLWLRGGAGLGALDFSLPGETPPPWRPAMSIIHVQALGQAADRFNQGEEIPGDIALLFQAGSSPGGARPKAVVADNENRQWIAKLSFTSDPFDMVGLECAAMRTAQASRLDVPEVQILPLGRRRALLVERFDVLPGGGRRHGISFSALMREGRGVFVTNYRAVFDVLRQHTRQPVNDDLGRLYRQVVFNAVIGNRDDHLKNLMMLHDGKGYQLSPAFDLLPNVGERVEHVIAYGLSNRPPSRADLLAMADHLNIPAKDILDEVVEAAGQFTRHAQEAGVPPNQIQRFQSEIDHQRGRLAPPAIRPVLVL